ncbi:MAG: NADH-ubiquinone oxidoreductase-F iron-sulfur binding region domain-containing protein [bacterium]|nr:NADH-ubiquinone oxidoreductase-F iron-sulfur binding region domain-containing protein [bacterium]
MDKNIKDIKDLNGIKKSFQAEKKRYKHIIRLCTGAGCVSSKCNEVKQTLVQELEQHGIMKDIRINSTGCIGSCDVGPTMIIEPQGVFFCRLTAKDIPSLVKSYFFEGNIPENFCYHDIKTGKTVPLFKDIDFFKQQTKVVLKNCGLIDYGSLEEYISQDGYFALAKVLSGMKPEDVIKEVIRSGLRGRGGGGFSTGLKWEMARKTYNKIKYVICNADEGDPGAFMDRSLLEGDPHSVLEGMAVAGFAIGSNRGIVYIRAEYPLAVERLEQAIKDARQYGLLGKNILGQNFDFDVDIRIGAGAFVCGEETALMASVEGKRGEPRQKPPFPTDAGLLRKPTIINNVETFGNITSIILNTADWFASMGTEKSKGTKVFALAGDINNTGLIEVPMGIKLGEIIYDIGGGIPKGKRFKVAQTGGPSGGCLTRKHLNTSVDYDSLVELGAIMGSGGMVVMDENTCMVDMARFFMDFVQEESCGKCVPCRLGTKRMLEILERITRGEGREGDVELLIELGTSIKESALCGLGQTAPNPVLSTIKYFRKEYDDHILHKYCSAGVCSDLFISPCQNVCPAGVNVPGYIALIAAGRVLEAYKLIRKENPFPSVCGRVCTHPCENVCRRGQLDEPIAIADLKRYAADYVLNSDEPFMDLVFPKKGKSVGIIGAGPSGLTCGYYLARLGYDVTIYEAQPVAGGVLAFGIPQYRLPKEMLEKEINTIKQVGINILTNMKVGMDILFNDLRKKHHAVYIATGTQHSRKIGIEGEDLKGVYHGLDFLRDVNLHKNVKVKGVVAIIGGGNTAIDAARAAVRKGAAEVHVIYRRTREDMPADKREIQDALDEGIVIHTLTDPLRFTADSNGRVKQIECVRMELDGFDPDGRKKTQKIHGTNFTFNVDIVIPAVSQYSDLPFVKKSEIETTEWGTFIIDEVTQMTTLPGVFAGGDVTRGSDVVITAIADGKRAARSMDKYMGGKGELNTGEPIEIPKPAMDEGDVIEHERFLMKYLDPEKRKHDFEEVSQGFHKLNAIAEAMRCLRCDRKS